MKLLPKIFDKNAFVTGEILFSIVLLHRYLSELGLGLQTD
jgi:hypothetical protein